jgi:hypothetical protein
MPRTSVLTRVAAVLAEGRLTEEVTPLAAVNEVVLPITVPAAFAKESRHSSRMRAPSLGADGFALQARSTTGYLCYVLNRKLSGA